MDWLPELPGDRAKYLGLADAIAADIGGGRLAPGTRLPTHRELADQLEVTPGTVSRGYAEAQRRGLVRGEVGRGTFVLAPSDAARPGLSVATGGGAVVDLSLNYTAYDRINPILDPVLAAAAHVLHTSISACYQHELGTRYQRETGAGWIRQWLPDTTAEDVVLTAGAQHGIVVALGAVARPGDRVLCGYITYPGVRAAARFLGLRLEGVAMDAHGLVPDAVRAACEQFRPRALYCMPTLHNPTTLTLSRERREQLVAICNAFDVTMIEDDVYAYLDPDAPPPIATLAPERTLYITSLSKSVLSGLRIGYLRAPRALVAGIGAAVAATVWMPSPPMAELASWLIEEGHADRVVAWKRRRNAERHAIVARELGPLAPARPLAPHLWLELPDPWRASELVSAAKSRDVLINGPEPFGVGRRFALPQAVRICLGTAIEDAAFARGVRTLASLLGDAPPPTSASV